jgi:uncharacterized protein
MARVVVTGDEVVVQLSTGEKIAGLHGGIRLPRGAVRGVEVVDDALATVRGIRAPGLGVPRRVAIGTWRHRDGKDFVVARRGQRGLRLALSGQPWQAVLVGLPDPDEVARRLR